MNKLLPIGILAALLGACTPRTLPEKQSTTSTATVERISRIEKKLYPIYNVRGEERSKTIPQMMKENGIAGVSIAFVDKGEIAWTKCYGYASLEDSIKVNPNTIFRAASLSKPLTAMAALHLVEAGRLALHQDVNQTLLGWKLPNNPLTPEDKVTVAHLIGHRSGIKNGVHPGYRVNESMPTNVEILSGKKLNMPTEIISVPGQKNNYSNVGYMVLSKLLTDVTHQGFNEVMNDLIFKPCGMESSTFNQDIGNAYKKRLATGYDSVQHPLPYYRYPFEGAGSLLTTPSDLGKFLAAILDDYHQPGAQHIISKAMAQQVFNKEAPKLGFNKWHDGENFVFRNDGSLPGYTCFLMGSLNNKQGLVVMLNSNSDGANALLGYVMRAVAMEYDWQLFEPEFYDRVDLPAKDLDKYVGLYTSEGDTVHVRVRTDQLILEAKETGSQELTPIGHSAFLLPSIPMKYTFERDSMNRVNRVKIKNETGDDNATLYRIN